LGKKSENFGGTDTLSLGRLQNGAGGQMDGWVSFWEGKGSVVRGRKVVIIPMDEVVLRSIDCFQTLHSGDNLGLGIAHFLSGPYNYMGSRFWV
jgi:hypothetical protein